MVTADKNCIHNTKEAAMWQIVSFDLPVDDAAMRKEYRLFRKRLLQEGFMAMQKSLYFRWFDTLEKARAFQRMLLKASPQKGGVVVFDLTEKCFEGALKLEDGKIAAMPPVPEAWTIF